MTKHLYTLSLLLLVSSFLVACGDKKPVNSPQTSKNTKPDVAQERLDKGSKLWAESKPELAEVEFRKAIEEHPESAKAHARLAGLLLTQNKTSESIPAYQDAITLDPENPKLFAALSIAYLHQQKFDMAKAMADQALALNPEFEQAEKLNKYITTKQEVLKQANQVSPGAIKPDDAMHNSANTSMHKKDKDVVEKNVSKGVESSTATHD